MYTHASFYEKNEKDYYRPHCELGDLNGPDGNAFFVMGNASAVLKKNKLLQEAKEITELFMKWFPNTYEEGLNKISYFLDLSIKEELIDEDDEYLYVKIRKNESDNDAITTELHKKIYSLTHLEDLLNEYDINSANCYGRTILFYPQDNDEIFKAILNNSEIDLFHKDHMDSHPLFILDDNNKILEIFDKMLECDIGKTIDLINSKDVFNRNFMDKFIMNIEQQINKNPKDCLVYIQKFSDIIAKHNIINEFSFSKFKNFCEHNSNNFAIKEELLSLIIPGTNQTLYNAINGDTIVEEARNQEILKTNLQKSILINETKPSNKKSKTMKV